MTTSDFDHMFNRLVVVLARGGEKVPTASWQSQDVTSKPGMTWTREVRHQSLRLPFSESIEELQQLVKPNLPWAEDHFLERVSGDPLNPPPSEAWWPFAQRGNAEHKEGEIFSHTYPERFWPKFANSGGKMRDSERRSYVPHVGVRYEYGDLGNVIALLKRDPYTRQAFLPVWFPEDTGAVSGQRVPCTLGYQFMLRPNVAEIVYTIRSCDLFRHFRDDVYMACRLLQWVMNHVGRDVYEFRPKYRLVMNIASLHTFEGDEPVLQGMAKAIEDDEEPIYGSTF